MSQENVEIIRATIDALNRGDLDAALENTAPGFVWDNSAAMGEHRGVYTTREQMLFAMYAIPKRGAAPAPELLDIDRTSDSGAWSGRFTHDLVGVDHLQATLVKTNIGPQGHSHICETDSASWAFPSPT